MSEAAILSLVQFAVKFGLDAAIAIANSLKTGATIDDAIAALELAKTKTADQYLEEAKANAAKAAAVAAAVPPAV